MITKFKLFEYISRYDDSNKGDFNLHTSLDISESESEEIYKQVANFYSDEDLSYLGSGSLGAAFSLDDKVLKITTDKNEIDNIEYLRKKNFHGIVSYYDARKINLYINDELFYKKDIFAIIMDKVEPLDEIELECYHILYRIGFKDVKELLCFTYTLSHSDIEEGSATNFRKINNGDRVKEIYEIIMNAKNRSDLYHKMKEKLGDYVSLEFAQLKDLQKSEKFQETLFRFYNDILDLLCDVIRYKLSLYDSHEKNVGKDENGHFKMIDLGFRTDRKRVELKLKPINVYIESEKEKVEEFMLLISHDGITFEYSGTYESYQEAVDEMYGDIEEKNINLNGKTILIFYTNNVEDKNKKYYRIISEEEEPEIFNKQRWILQDPNQLSLNLWQSTKSKKF